MGLTIRLKPTGRKNRKLWRVVVTDQRASQNSRVIEELGFYNGLVDPPQTNVSKERYLEWVKKGAQPSPTLKTLIGAVKS